jgi:hypothetical protein
VDEIRAEADWAAKALVNAEVETTGQGIDSKVREAIKASVSESLENRALENGLDIYALNDKIFQARTGRAVMDDLKKEAGVFGLEKKVAQSTQEQATERLQGLENAQRLFGEDEFLDYEANAAAKLMLGSDQRAHEDHSPSVNTLKNNLVSAAKYADLDVNELTTKLEAGKAVRENVDRKSQELKAFGVMRNRPELDHLNDLQAYQEATERRSIDAKYIARFVIKEESPELSGGQLAEAESALTEKLIQSEVKGEIDLAGMKAETQKQQADLSDEIEF